MGAAKKRTGSQKKPSKSKSTSASRRAARKATGQAAQKAGKYKSIKSSPVVAKQRSRASQRRKEARQKEAAAAKAAAVAKIKAAEKAAANKKTAVAPGTGRTTGGRGRTVEKPGARAAAAARSAQAARMMAVNNPRSAPRTPPEMSPRNIAAQQAAARRAAAANKQAAQSMRSAGIRDLTGTPTGGRRGSNRTSASTAAANQQAAQSLLGAGYRNVKGDKNKSTILQQIMSGFRNTLRGEGLPGNNQSTAKPITTDGPSTRLPPPQPEVEVDPFRPPPELPPEIVDEFPPVMPPVMPPRFPQYPGMYGGIGAFGYNPALMAFESQQGAGQVPYYMAAARNAMTPNMSPAFMHAARNYDILGGMQRTAPRPMEMMSAAERAQIAGMSNFSTPNYNSPYDQFNFFSNMVGGGGGKGMGRPAPQMAGGLAPFMMGMF